MVKYFRIVLLSLMFSLIIFSQALLIITKDIVLYQKLSIGIIVIAILAFIASLSLQGLFKSPLIKSYIVIMILLVVQNFLIIFVMDQSMYEELLLLGIPLLLLVLGYNINISESGFIKLMHILSFMTVVAVIYIMLDYGSFIIPKPNEFGAGKNQIGPLLASIAALNLFLFKTAKHKSNFYKIYLITLTLIILLGLLIMRARAASLCIILFYLLLYIELDFKRLVMVLSLTALLFYIIQDIIIASFFQGFDLNSINAISTGRWYRNIDAVNFILKYPLFGELENKSNLLWTHNYLILNLVKYGILGSVLIIILYLKLWRLNFVYLIKGKNYRPQFVGLFILFIPLFISIFEPTYPYGPGTSQSVVFFTLGYGLRSIVSNKISVKNTIAPQVYATAAKI